MAAICIGLVFLSPGTTGVCMEGDGFSLANRMVSVSTERHEALSTTLGIRPILAYACKIRRAGSLLALSEEVITTIQSKQVIIGGAPQRLT